MKCDIIRVVFSGEFVAHFKFTVLLMPNGPHRITGLSFEPELYQSDYTISDAELKVRNLSWYTLRISAHARVSLRGHCSVKMSVAVCVLCGSRWCTVIESYLPGPIVW